MAEESDKRVLTSEKVKELKWDADTVKFITTDMLSQYIDEEHTQWTTIGQAAFSGLSNIVSVQIPDNITTIDIGAFSGCTNLKSVTIGDNVIEIGSSAFKNCTSLLTIDTNNVSLIGSEAFYGCSSLHKVIVSDNVTVINSSVFRECTSLTETSQNKSLTEGIYLPSTIASIKDYAFYGCTGLTNFSVPSDVTSIGDYAFCNCTNLETITLSASLEKIGKRVFDGCNSLPVENNGCKHADTYLISVTLPEGSEPYIFTIPNGYKWIGIDAFRNDERLYGVIIPNSVIEICDDAFHGCTLLTTANFGTGVKRIDRCAFQNCISLPNITIPSNVETIGDYAFYGCSGARYVEIVNGCTTIGFSAFSGCISYSETVPSSYANKFKARVITTDRLGYVDRKLINPGYATSPGIHVITRTGNIKSVTMVSPSGGSLNYNVDDVNIILHLSSFTVEESTVNIVEGYMDNGTYREYTHIVKIYNVDEDGDPDHNTEWKKVGFLEPDTISTIANSKDTKVFIPASITSIGKLAFENCRKLSTFVVDGGNNSYSVDGDVLFNKNKTTIICCPITKSDTYTMPNTVTTISEFAFARCTKLTQVDVPSNISTIYPRAFIGCSALDTMKIGATTYNKASISNSAISNAYKSMPGNMVCWNFQYTPGATYNYNTYDPDASVELCNGGFHACLRLCDVFNYYGGRRKTNSDTKPYGTFVVYRVNLSGVSDVRNGKDSKVVASVITVTNDRIL